MRTYDIAVIGAGFSGTALAAQLLLQEGTGPVRIALVERAAQFSRGIAYSTSSEFHLLNVPASGMSALPEKPQHFVEWAQRRDPEVKPGDFLPRSWYGDYLEQLLRDAEKSSQDGSTFQRLSEEAGELARVNGSWRIDLDSGPIQAAQLVLALGNALPPRLSSESKALGNGEAMIVGNPWDADALSKVPLHKPVLVLGTGLTMMDVCLYLAHRGLRAPILAISRRGLLPHPHAAFRDCVPQNGETLLKGSSTSILALSRFLRRAAAEAQAEGSDWRATFAWFRGKTNEIWAGISAEEKRRFLKHLLPYWTIHRHRAPQKVFNPVQEMIREKKLRVRAGKILRLHAGEGEVEAEFLPRGSTAVETHSFGAAIYCTGPEKDFRKRINPSLLSLLSQDLLRIDELNMGLATTPFGAVLDPQGKPHPNLFTLGPLRLGQLWESTAVPEIRVQAAQLAEVLRNQV